MKLILLFLLLSFQSHAQFDFKYGTTTRSYPSVGADVNAQFGYSQILWGQAGPGSLMYGMIRPSISASSSVVVSNTDAKITLYPISFIGFGAGHRAYESEYEDFSFFDCEAEVRCTGDMNKDYIFAKIAFELGPLTSTFTYTDYRNSYEQVDTNNFGVGEYEMIIIANPNNEEVIQRTAFIGFKLNTDLFGIISDQYHFGRSQKNSQMTLGIYKFKWSVFDIILGAGSMHSSDQEAGTMAIFQLNHVLLPSLALF